LLPIHLMRYIFIINLNKSKEIFYTQMKVTKDGEKRVETARLPFRLVKVLTNQWLNAAIVVGWYIVSVCVQLVVFFASNMSCNAAAYPLATMQTLVVVFFIVCWTFGLIYDFVAAIVEVCGLCKKERALSLQDSQAKKPNTAKLCFKFFWEQFTKNDPFYYRLELYFVGPVIIVAYIIISVSILVFKVDALRPYLLLFS
jgi:hypothetical protein